MNNQQQTQTDLLHNEQFIQNGTPIKCSLGHVNPEGTVFCGECGEPLSRLASPPAVAVPASSWWENIRSWPRWFWKRMGLMSHWSWQKIQRHPFTTAGIIVVLLAIVAFTLAVHVFGWDWTGFTGGESKITITGTSKGTTTATELQPAKSLWDWLGLLAALAIPVVVGFGAAWFTRTQQLRDQEREKLQRERDQQLADQQAEAERESAEQRAKTERDIAVDNQREVALQGYLDKISDLLLKGTLGRRIEEGNSAQNYEARKIARVRTLAVLRGLDPDRKVAILLFLKESNLIENTKYDALHLTRYSGNESIVDLKGADLREVNLGDIWLDDINLKGVNLSRAKLRWCNLSGTDLREANLSGADMVGVNLSYANLYGADLSDASLSGADLTGAYLEEADLTGVHLGGANLQQTSLSGADMRGADLTGANLLNVDLRETCLSRYGTSSIAHKKQTIIEIVYRPELEGANLSSAHLTLANLSGANLTGVNLHLATLNQAHLRGAKLHGVDLREAMLVYAKLNGASLFGANLSGAKLYDADLSGADLRKANLKGASLSGAKLYDADLSGADLYEASLNNAIVATSEQFTEAKNVTPEQLAQISILRPKITSKLAAPQEAKMEQTSITPPQSEITPDETSSEAEQRAHQQPKQYTDASP